MRFLFPLLSLLFLTACGDRPRFEALNGPAVVVPIPKQMTGADRGLVLNPVRGISAASEAADSVARLFQDEVRHLFAVNLADVEAGDADVQFRVNTALPPTTYRIEVGDVARVSGGSRQALLHAKTTLLQLLQPYGARLILPQVTIEDAPDTDYRGLMVDLARQWHDVPTLLQLIDLAAYYKIEYLQLHFTDYQSYTLPSRIYPELSTPGRHYSFADLERLEAYAVRRGVTIVPEIDIPGHSSPFVRQYPEVFALRDTSENPWIINMGREAVYGALDSLIGEVLDVFQSTPYFHIGGDEAIFTSVERDPDVRAYVRKHGIDHDAHELYRHFLVRMNEIVRARGKQMCAWEGFRPEGKIAIPKDILVFEFETNRYLPGELLADGYSVVNTSWKPLYVVNRKKWEPRTIYDWNLYRWANWWSKAPSFDPIQVDETLNVIGAQMCAWEQPGAAAVPSLRRRLPVMAERIWNVERRVPYAEFAPMLDATDRRLTDLIDDDRQDELLEGHNWTEDMQETK